MEMSLISAIHQDGHFKTQKLEKLIRKELHIQNLREKIEKVTNNRIECLHKKSGKNGEHYIQSKRNQYHWILPT